MEQFFEESVKQELKSMDQRLYDLEEKMNSIDNKLTQVIEAIMGNPLTKAGGVVNSIELLEKKIKGLEEKVEKQEEFKKRLTWTVGLILAAAMIIQYLLDLYSHIK
jgi:archaellum component FlaC